MLSTACLQTTSNQLLGHYSVGPLIVGHISACQHVYRRWPDDASLKFLCQLSAKYSDLKRTFKSILFVCVLYGFKKTIAAPTAILIDLTIFVVGDQ